MTQALVNLAPSSALTTGENLTAWDLQRRREMLNNRTLNAQTNADAMASLKALRLYNAGYGILNNIYVIKLKLENNTASDNSDQATENITKKDDAVSVKDMVDNITNVFDVKISSLAKILGVSRGTIYNHIAGKHEHSDIEIYKRFNHISEEVRKSCKPEHIRKGLKSVLVDGRTLLAHLQYETNDKRILDICKIIEQKVAERAPKNSLTPEEARRASHRFSKQG